jgi:hypothetical protein
MSSRTLDQGLREVLAHTNAQIRTELEVVRAAFEDVVMRLELNKISSADLSTLFMGLAIQLKGESPLNTLQAALDTSSLAEKDTHPL